MKKPIILFVFLFAFIYKSHSQVKFIKNAYGEEIAYERNGKSIKSARFVHLAKDSHRLAIQPGDSTVADTLNNSMLVNMMNQFTIGDPSGAIILIYQNEEKEMKDMNDDMVFKLTESNHILNSAMQDVGWIEEDGSVYANDHNLLGQGMGIEFFKLAYLFFFCNK